MTTVPVLADIGLPLIVVVWPPLIFGLLPLVLIEASVLRRHVHLSTVKSIKAMGLANLASTIVGVPVTYVVVLILQGLAGWLYDAALGGSSRRPAPIPDLLLAFGSPGWLPNLDVNHAWMLPIAMLVLLVPLFLSSWLLENEIAWRYLAPVSSQLRMTIDYEPPAFDYPQMRRGTFYANLVSYGALAGLVVLWLIWLLVR